MSKPEGQTQAPAEQPEEMEGEISENGSSGNNSDETLSENLPEATDLEDKGSEPELKESQEAPAETTMEEDLMEMETVTSPSEETEEPAVETSAEEKRMEVVLEENITLNLAPGSESTAGEGIPLTSVAKMFHEIVTIASKQGVTDIHVEPALGDKHVLVRLRKEGACRNYEKIPGYLRKDLIAYIKTQAGLDRTQSNIPQSGKIEWRDGPKRVDLQVVIFPTIGNVEDVMIRVALAGKPVPAYISLDMINYSEPNLNRIKAKITQEKGMVLVAGPVGTGKTTSLFSYLGHINSPDKKIITIENPVEVRQKGLRQIQLNEKEGFNYKMALRTILMGSPDVILVGEMNETETFNIGMGAASKHLVFSAINSESALHAIRSVRALNVDQKLFADSLLFISSQRLVKALCKECKEDYHPTRKEFDNLAKLYGEQYFPELGMDYSEDLNLKRPVGCKQCVYTGYAEPVAIQEVLEATSEIKRLIAQKASLDEIRGQTVKDGMITMIQDAIYKIFKGDCDRPQVQSIAAS